MRQIKLGSADSVQENGEIHPGMFVNWCTECDQECIEKIFLLICREQGWVPGIFQELFDENHPFDSLLILDLQAVEVNSGREFRGIPDSFVCSRVLFFINECGHFLAQHVEDTKVDV